MCTQLCLDSLENECTFPEELRLLASFVVRGMECLEDAYIEYFRQLGIQIDCALGRIGGDKPF